MLAEHRRAHQGRQDGVDAHEDSEHVGGHTPQGDQVGQERDRRGEHSGGRRAGERGGRGRVLGEGQRSDGQVQRPGHGRGRRRTLQAGHPGADGAVEQDVAAPAHGGRQRQADAQVVGAGTGAQQHGDRSDRRQCQAQVRAAARGGQDHGQWPEEFEGDRQAEPDAVDRRVEGQVHGGEHRGQTQDEAPLGSRQLPQPGTSDAQQDERGHPLAHRDRPRGAQDREGEGGHGRAHLVGQSAAHHERRPGQAAGGGAGRTCARGSCRHASTMRQRRPYAKCIRRTVHTMDVWMRRPLWS